MPYTAAFMGGIFRDVMTYEAAITCACLFLCLYINVITSIFNSLINRFVFMFRPHWRKYVENKYTISAIVVMHLSSYAGVTFLFVTTSSSYAETRQIATIETETALIEFMKYPSFVYVPSRNERTKTVIIVYFFIVLTIATILFIAIVVFLKNIRDLKETEIVSKTMRSLVISTLVQAFLCVLFVFTPVAFLLCTLAFNISNSANSLNILLTMLSFHGTVDNLCILYFVAPYRRYCLSLICCRPGKRSNTIEIYETVWFGHTFDL
uniref:G_PROTEIN_RECEP_F1_2 domain-containing protein n=1 Tax=Panagrellus redivivus TaxID=6233 RepID=A0A7E4WB36_PANRE